MMMNPSDYRHQYHWDMLEDPDGTKKFSTVVPDKGVIEVSVIRNKDHVDVLCLPTHYQCSLGCTFCHLTKLGAKTMEPISSDDMMPLLIDLIGNMGLNMKQHVLLSFMGAGEPTLNTGLVVDVYQKLSTWFRKEHWFQVAISTMAPSALILQHALGDLVQANVPTKLHFSLHATDEIVRSEMIPGSKSRIEDILLVVGAWGAIDIPGGTEYHMSNDSAEIHYTLIEGVNDNVQDLLNIQRFCIQYDLPIKFITFNEVDELKAVDETMTYRWCQKLLQYRIKARSYSPPGKAIGSSCGAFDLSNYKIRE